MLARVSYNSVRHISSRVLVSDEVSSALHSGRGVVALESTVITHGLPYPKNFEVARMMEEVVRNEGATPATIALIDGWVQVGLSGKQLDHIASPDSQAVKASTRDIPNVLAKKLVGGTTVAATMWAAHQAGIRVFATGGIGGVHRGAEQTFDISADLIDLGRIPVAVVCAGAKSILDIPKTLEFLETHGVNVIVYDTTNFFPGFFTPRTANKAPFNSESITEIAEILRIQDETGLRNGTLVACPLPGHLATEGRGIEDAIQQALEEARQKHVASKEVTPFLLSRVSELTKSASTQLNIELLKNNARIAARLANEYVKRPSGSEGSVPAEGRRPARAGSTAQASSRSGTRQPNVLCIGATIVDFEVVTSETVKDDGASYPAEFSQRCGGVGRNHADALTRLGGQVPFISVIGNDERGTFFREQCEHMDLRRVEVAQGVPTATYLSVNVRGNIVHGFSAVEHIIPHLTPQLVRRNEEAFKEADYILMDGNTPVDTLNAAVSLAKFHHKKVWFEPTCLRKMRRIFDADAADAVNAISPNINEFREYCKALGVNIPDTVLSECEALADRLGSDKNLLHRVLLPSMDTMLITMGRNGVVALQSTSRGVNIRVIACPPIPEEDVISVSGAGDCFNSGFLSAHLHGLAFDDCLRIGTECALLSLRSMAAVPDTLNAGLLRTDRTEGAKAYA